MRGVGLLPWLVLLSGCASLPAYRMEPPALANSGEFHYIENVPPVAQGAYQCGPAALESVIRRWGREADAVEIGRLLYRRGARGILNFTLAQHARDRGFWTEIREGTPGELRSWIQREIPPIAMLHVGPFWSPTYHFLVVRGFNDREQIFYANTGHPETRAIRYPHFLKRWRQAGCWTLVISPPERVDWELTGDQAADLGLLLERSGRLGLAERWYRKGLEKSPESASVRFNLANVYSRTNRRREAKGIYRALLEEKPGWAPPGNNLAWLHLEERNPKEAVRVIETAFGQGAERGYEILDTLGTAYCRLKQSPKARTCFLEALEKVPPENAQARNSIQSHLDECRAEPSSP
ncbi:MAG: tetratricopeptide repeat protein [Candidatus Omnitrophica bacterium]|nr:tetratricopeptide repeat protein [Candidatus Omnitrophota bacterium]